MTTTKMLASDWMQTPQVAQSEALRLPCSHAPYGHRSAPTGAPDTGLTGQRRETGLGWYLLGNGHRCYSPVLMRFHSPDLTNSPWRGGGVNSYIYCQGDPINFHDRSGRIKGWANSMVSTSAYQSFSTGTNTTAGILPAITAVSFFTISKMNSASISRTDAALLAVGGVGAAIYGAGKVARYTYDENVATILEDAGTTLVNAAGAASMPAFYKSTRDARLQNLADQHISSSPLMSPTGTDQVDARSSLMPSTPAGVKVIGGRALLVSSSSTPSNSAYSSRDTLSTPGFAGHMKNIFSYVTGNQVRSSETINLDDL